MKKLVCDRCSREVSQMPALIELVGFYGFRNFVGDLCEKCLLEFYSWLKIDESPIKDA